jgi:hypothetical protein
MTANRYVAVQPSRVNGRKQIGPASYLEDFLVDHQTDAAGSVFYGKAISYAWIRSKWKDAPPIRTLERHMARLKAAGRVLVHRLTWGHGMVVRVLGSVKWSETPQQLPLFPAPAVVRIAVPAPEVVLISGAKPLSKLSKPQTLIPPKVAVIYRHFWRFKEVKNLRKETTYGASRPPARASPVENLDDPVLSAEIETLLRKFKSAG